MRVIDTIRQAGLEAFQAEFQVSLEADALQINETKPEFRGDYTLVTFALSKAAKAKPEDVAHRWGQRLLDLHPELFASFEVVKGFLNLSLNEKVLLQWLDALLDSPYAGLPPTERRKILIEYSSPNTNKPLHLGHLRNNFLGYSVARILEACGHEVIKANLVNDRGIHICKSMVAWMHLAQGATPESSGIKGDHLVGDYYVAFNQALKQQIQDGQSQGLSEQEAERQAPWMLEAQDMLRKWEQNDPEVRSLWTRMNAWVYAGFADTYRRMGVAFDTFYYESDTYLLGKGLVEEGLAKGIFFRKPDGSVWVDLSEDGLDEKLLLRADGTSVYMTQDLGTAQLKYDDFGMDQSIYVIGDEQNYHMKVLQLILQKLGKPYADHIYHLSYGMVELPHGRMKSREGTVVDADDLMDEMVATAARHTQELGKVEGFSETELNHLYRILGMGAMKFYLLRVDPKKKMIFNPEESIDFHGFTGTFIQYAYTRIRSILRKEGVSEEQLRHAPIQIESQDPLLSLERQLLLELERFGPVMEAAADALDPSQVATFAYQLAKTFNSFYNELSVSKAESPSKKELRLKLSLLTADILQKSLSVLGIQVPERM